MGHLILIYDYYLNIAYHLAVMLYYAKSADILFYLIVYICT